MQSYRNRPPKSELPTKNPYTIYNPHTRVLSERVWKEPYYQFVSIDPSVKNFGFRIEQRYKNGIIVAKAFSRTNFLPAAERVEKGEYYSDLYESVTRFLDQYYNDFLETHIFLIERQLPQNYQAVRLSQHVITYLNFRMKDAPRLPMIIEIDSKLTKRQLKCPSGLSEGKKKEWLVVKAKELLQKRGDEYSLSIMEEEEKNKRKRIPDDLADTVDQIEAWCILMGLPQTQERRLGPRLKIVFGETEKEGN